MDTGRAELQSSEKEKPLWVRRAREVGHNRLALAGAMLPPVMLTLIASAVTAPILGKGDVEWLFKRSNVLGAMKETLEGGMDAIGESKNILVKAQRLARALVGSAPSAIVTVGAIANGVVAVA